MQKFIKFKFLISLFTFCLTKQTDIQQLDEFSNFNYKGILKTDSDIHLFNFDNKSQNSLIIQFMQTNIHFELNYEDQLSQKRFNGSIDYQILDDMRLEQSGYSTINVLGFKNNQIEENFSCQIFFTIQFNQTKIFQNDNSFEFDIFFKSSSQEQICNIDMNLNVKFEKSQVKQIVESLTIILIYITLQALQFQCLYIFKKQIEEEEETFTYKKILIYPYYFLIVFQLVFSVEIIVQLEEINNKNEWFYIIPIFLTTFATIYQLFGTFYLLIAKAYQTFFQRISIICLQMFFYIIIKNSIILISAYLIMLHLDTSPYYLIFISTLLMPQIIYNFKFKKIELNGIYYLKLMAVNIFQILYTRGCPNYHQNNLSNSEKIVSCSITLVLFCLQTLIIHFQYQNGPRNLLPKKLKTKNEQSLLNRLADDDQCPICLSELKDQNIFYKKNELHKQILIKTPCNHIFHQECLELWYELKQFCPICNEQLNDSDFV